MTPSDHPNPESPATPDEVSTEIAIEQAHVDRVYAELAKAASRVALVEAEGLARGRTDRTGDVRDEEITGLFERDALMFSADRRRTTLETQYEGLVFGRLDLEHDVPTATARTEREVRYVGRLGVRDDDYEPLVIDWRAPAAAPFYRATPVEPMGVLRRRVLRCKGADVVGVEDDLMVPEAPDDLVVVGDGALIAALTRTRGAQMRDIVATIQRHQDEAIRAPARGVTEITGGPGTGKTVVALHRAAYLLYSDRRRFEAGGILVVGPSAAYTAYIERVLPSLGEESVTLRSLGDVVEGVTATRLDTPEVGGDQGVAADPAAAGAAPLATRRRSARRSRSARSSPARRVRLDAPALRPGARPGAAHPPAQPRRRGRPQRALAEAGLGQRPRGRPRRVPGPVRRPPRRRRVHGAVVAASSTRARCCSGWPTPTRLRRYAPGCCRREECDAARRLDAATRSSTGTWSVADAALVDDLAARLGPVQADRARSAASTRSRSSTTLAAVRRRRGAAGRHGRPRSGTSRHGRRRRPARAAARGPHRRPGEYAHVLVDEAQDLSPMQWRMLGRRGRDASWTVVGDAAQASWPDAAEAGRAREEAFGGQERRAVPHGHQLPQRPRDLRLRGATSSGPHVPDADIPQAVRETGVDPVDRRGRRRRWPRPRPTPSRRCSRRSRARSRSSPRATLGRAAGRAAGRLTAGSASSTRCRPRAWSTTRPSSSTPTRSPRESPGGVRVLYVALTRAAHRMTVLRPA